MKLLLHTCCAPCSVYCIKSLRKEGIEPVVYWFNPNIHPYIEYKTRRDTLKEYTKSIGINAILYIGNQEFGHIFYNIHLDTSLDSRLYFYQ